MRDAMIDNKLEEVLGRLLTGMERMDIKGVSIDSRTIREGELFVAIKGERFDGHDFVHEALKKGAWGAMVERSALESRYQSFCNLKNIIPVEDTLLSLQEMSAMHRKKFSIPVIGIAGSNGKTTTKEMLASILRQTGPVLKTEGNYNNHIGVPLTLMKLNKTHRAAVIEMGMSGLGEIATLVRLALPDIGVITNIGPVHLEFLGSIERVAQAEGELIEHMRQDGTAVLNRDDRFFGSLKSRFHGKIVTFGLTKDSDIYATDMEQDKDITDFKIHAPVGVVSVRLKAVGRHNVYNALAAAAAALTAGSSLDAVKYGLEEFMPSGMRSELKEIKGRVVLEDCYNANPRSMEVALETLVSLRPGRMTIAVLGDMLELGEASIEAHRETGRIAARLGIDLVITIGELARHIAEGAVSQGMHPMRIVQAGSTSEAARLLHERSKPGDAILIKGSRGMKMEKILEEF